MLQKTLFVAGAAILAMLLTSSQAQAWGAYHAGYTHVGYGGVQHYGHTAAAGPNGAYSGSHYGSYGAGGAYHSGSAAHYGAGGYSGGAYHYGGSSSYGGYHAGGFGGASVSHSSYSSGVYRRY